jgi:hypothetical protein
MRQRTVPSGSRDFYNMRVRQTALHGLQSPLMASRLHAILVNVRLRMTQFSAVRHLVVGGDCQLRQRAFLMKALRAGE